jgi:hypothetical protein
VRLSGLFFFAPDTQYTPCRFNFDALYQLAAIHNVLDEDVHVFTAIQNLDQTLVLIHLANDQYLSSTDLNQPRSGRRALETNNGRSQAIARQILLLAQVSVNK